MSQRVNKLCKIVMKKADTLKSTIYYVKNNLL